MMIVGNIMMQLRIRLFGEPEFSIGGKEHAFDAPPRALPLLAYLLMHRETRLNRETVSNVIWPDVTEEEARANLRRHLHYIKRALPPLPGGESWMDVSKTIVRWNPTVPVWLDVAEFENLSKSPKGRERAALLYRADLFERCYDEWIVYDRDRLRNVQIANLGSLLKICDEQHDLEGALTHASRLLAIDPWREDVVRTLMEVRARTGDRAGALAEFERLAERLREELDADPMPETAELYERIRSLKAAPPVPQTAAATLQMAGRSQEMEALERCWRNAQSGHADIALIGGEAGSGKTTLIQWLAALAQKRGGNAFTGVASLDRGTALSAFEDILRDSRALWERDLPASSRSLLGVLLPEMGEPSGGESGEQVRFFTAIGDALELAAKDATLVLCLEDLHWAGETTVLLLDYLVRRLQHSRVLIAGSYREEEVPLAHPLRAMRRRFSRSPFFTHIPLSNLNEDDVLELARNAAGPEAAQTMHEQLWHETGGNPLLVRELLTEFARTGEIAPTQTVRAHIASRIAGLDPQAKLVAQSAAVLGSSLDVELLAELTGTGHREVAIALNELCGSRIMHAAAELHDGYAFSHQLFAQAAYDAAAPAWRRAAHARTMLLLQDLYGEAAQQHAATLAYHAERGGLYAEASDWYRLAAQRAYAAYANGEAHTFIDRSIEYAAQDGGRRFAALLVAESLAQRDAARERQAALIDQLTALADGGEQTSEVLSRRIELEAALNQMDRMDASIARLESILPAGPQWQARLHWHKAVRAYRFSQHDRCVEEIRAAQAIYASLDDRESLLRLQLLLFDVALKQGTSAQTALEAARELAAASDDPALRARLASAEAQLLLHEDAARAYERATAMLDAARESGDRRLEATASLYQGASAAYLGDVKNAREHLEQARRMFGVAGNVADQVRVWLWEALAEMNVSNNERAKEICERALAQALEWELYDLAFHLTNNLAIVEKWLGNPDRARDLCYEALRLCERRALAGFRARPLQNLAFLEYEQGRFEQAVTYFDELLGTSPAMSSEERLAVCACLGVCAARLGDLGRARELAKESGRLIGTPGLHSYQQEERYWIVALLSRLIGEPRDASRYARLALESLEERERLIPDPESARRFAAEPSHALIRAAAQRDEWPPEFTPLPA